MTMNAPRPRLTKRRAAASRMPRGVRVKLAAAAACGAGFGALLEFFLDPNAGRRRRHATRDRALSRMRRTERRAFTRARRAETHALGIARRTVNARRPAKAPADDVALAHKVESEVFRRAGVPKGQIDVNAEAGVVSCAGSSSAKRTSIGCRSSREASRACAGWRTCFTCRARRRRPAGRSSGVTGGRSRSAKRHAPAPRVGSHTARREADSVSIRLWAERLSRRDSGSTDRLRARQPRRQERLAIGHVAQGQLAP